MAHPGTSTGRLRIALSALALFVLTAVIPAGPASAQDSIELTMMYHGSVSGKIAPCG